MTGSPLPRPDGARPLETMRGRLNLALAAISLALCLSWLVGAFSPRCAGSCLYLEAAYALSLALLGHRLFLPALLGSTFVSISGLSMGVQSLPDLGMGVSLAGLGFCFAERIASRRAVTFKANEVPRQAIHAAFGILFCLMILAFGTYISSGIILAGTLAGMLIMHLVQRGLRGSLIERLMRHLERGGAIPGEGSLYYALGVLFALGLLRDSPIYAISVILILSLGDSLATVIGRRGRHPLPWNGEKSFEGSLGFILGCLPALLVLPGPATAIAIIVAWATESLPRIDDNITVPMASAMAYRLILGPCG